MGDATAIGHVDLAVGRLASGGLRVFSSPRGAARYRRATDVFLLVVALLGLVALVLAYPPGRFERVLVTLFANVPHLLRPLWSGLRALLALWALALAASAALSRRWSVLLQALASLALAIVVGVVAARFAIGTWPRTGGALWNGSGIPRFPGVRLAETAAVSLTISPHLVRPLQSANRWLLALGFLGALLAAEAAPGGVAAGFLIAVVAASAVRLAFGTSAGRPQLSEVMAALAELGIEAERPEVEDWPVSGVFVVRAVDRDGRPLLVKVHGRDAYDNQLLEKAWRTLWYQDTGPGLRLGRVQVAEHEALVTLLARGGGVPTHEVLRLATTPRNALLVLGGDARPLEDLTADQLGDEVVHGFWDALAALHRAGVAHRRIDTRTVALVGGRPGLVDFGGGSTALTPDRQWTDRSQLLVTTATRVGAERALAAAQAALDSAAVGSLVPYLQPAALSGPLRQATKDAGIDLDELRKEAAAAVGVEDPKLVRLRRVTWWTFAQTALLILAAFAVLSFATSIDYEQLGSALEHASWGWIALGLVVAQVPRLTQALSTLGSLTADLRFGPVYVMQLATNYMNLALPSSAARLAVNIRFFQRQGVPPAAAVTAGGIDSATSTVIQAVLLVLLLVFSESQLHLELSAPSGGLLTVLWILVGVLVVSVAGVFLIGRVRRFLFDRVRTWWPQVRAAFATLRSSNKLFLLVFGSLATELLFAVTLGIFALGFGTRIGLTDLLVINISVALFSSLIPVPGGIGVTELGLTIGLTSAGMSEATALGAVLLYRIATFYLPPVWGVFALRWLQKAKHL